jgi:rare lipoprotein A
MDGSITMRLRAAIAAAVVLGLGGYLAPGYAKDITPIPTETAAITAPAQADVIPVDALNNLAVPDASGDDAETGEWETIDGGMASWYGAELAGHRTASGERFDPNELTAANRTLPLGSHVRVTYQGRSVVVRINDRGPFAGHRVIDLSRAAAERIGLRRAGSGKVALAVLDADGDGIADQ